VNENDAAAIVEKIESIRRSPLADCADIGKNNFYKELCYKGYIDIYKELVKP